MTNSIITLPGRNKLTGKQKLSPEKLIIDYLEHMLNSNDSDDFWCDESRINANIQKPTCRERIIDKIYAHEAEIQTIKDRGESAKGKSREFYKKLFKDQEYILKNIFLGWLSDPNNQEEISNFVKNLELAFKKVSQYNGLSPALWE